MGVLPTIGPTSNAMAPHGAPWGGSLSWEAEKDVRPLIRGAADASALGVA